MNRSRRSGVVLLSVLWATAMASLIAAGAVVAARQGYEASRNRMSAELANWLALDCASRLQSKLDSVLGKTAGPLARHRLWAELPTSGQGVLPGCTISIAPSGTRLGVNEATRDQLLALALEASPQGSADVLVDIVQSRLPIEDVRELELVPELARYPAFAALLSADSERVSLRFAPREVLVALPGMSPMVADAILRLRVVDSLPDELVDLLGLLPKRGADRLLNHFPEFARSAVVEPAAWNLRVDATSGRPAITASIEMRVAFGRRMVVQRARRSW